MLSFTNKPSLHFHTTSYICFFPERDYPMKVSLHQLMNSVDLFADFELISYREAY